MTWPRPKARKRFCRTSSRNRHKTDSPIKVDEINRSHDQGKMPPGISGKVTFVDKTWNFVMLNVGLSNGVVPEWRIDRLSRTQLPGQNPRDQGGSENDAVAEILPDIKGDIQVGDTVLN